MLQSVSQISSLQQALNAALDAYKTELAAQNLPEPSLTTSVVNPIDEISFVPTAVLYESRRVALASLGLLRQLVAVPHEAVGATVMSTLEAASLRFAAEVGLTDVLAAAPDPEAGLSTADIATKIGVNSTKLERVLRLLVTQGWFREPSPGTFANNRLSTVIKTGAPGWYAAAYWNGLVHRISDKLPAQLTHPDPAFRDTTDGAHCAWNIAYDTPKPYFGADGWLAANPSDMLKFGRVMGSFAVLNAGIAADFPWEEVAKGKEAIVDIGGGQGTLCCALAETYPNISTAFIVQDLPEGRETAESYIKSRGLESRVSFEAQDFFAPQQRNGKYVFMLQRVLHDWDTQEGARILARVRDVLNEDSKLLIIDSIIGNGVIGTTGTELKESLSQVSQNGRYAPVPPPPFVPADFGEASRVLHQVNVVLGGLCNSFDRTLPELTEMVELAGLKIAKVHPTRGWSSITEVVKA